MVEYVARMLKADIRRDASKWKVRPCDTPRVYHLVSSVPMDVMFIHRLSRLYYHASASLYEDGLHTCVSFKTICELSSWQVYNDYSRKWRK